MRPPLHRRDLQEHCEADLRARRCARRFIGLFNASLGGNTRRATCIHQSGEIEDEALKALLGAPVALNIWRATARQARPRRI